MREYCGGRKKSVKRAGNVRAGRKRVWIFCDGPDVFADEFAGD